MNSFELLKVLIEKVEDYSKIKEYKSDLSIDDFFSFINNTTVDPKQLQSKWINNKKDGQLVAKKSSIERVIAQHILYLNRYIKFYAKSAFQGKAIKNLDDFGLLVTVLQEHSISKTELIRRNIMEKSKGIEAVNRLIKNNLFIQVANPKDQRSQVISLSDLGRTSLMQTFGQMETLGRIASGDLNEKEKYQLAEILQKLDHFHNDNYHNKSLKVLEDYLPNTFRDKEI